MVYITRSTLNTDLKEVYVRKTNIVLTRLLFELAIVSLKRANNQTRFAVKSDIVIYPIDKNHHAVAKADQEEQVHEHPNKPGKNTLEFKMRQIYHRLVTAYSGHAALVFIKEGFHRFIFK